MSDLYREVLVGCAAINKLIFTYKAYNNVLLRFAFFSPLPLPLCSVKQKKRKRTLHLTHSGLQFPNRCRKIGSVI